ncbi:MAG: bifunctional glutamate N-acetyltransferase/amino-acid acetyltransferase ArgJ [Pseudomonadales bacterium]|nr:bifunctional glutamate N-acetyltransferase/amino-acid acetyltransferase ArgJ [Pseudomonadales bacterium]
MAVGSGCTGEFHPVAGIKLAAAKSEIRYADRLDLVLIELAENSSVAGIYTQNAFCAAPVAVTKAHTQNAFPRYFLINTGNANAGTGKSGKLNALRCCQVFADLGGVSVQQVLPFSTGVIGEELPVDKILLAAPILYSDLSENNWPVAAEGILTTDTRPKLVSTQLEIDGKLITITGIAKGSGMIKPNMATMLAYVFTDADIDAELLDQLLRKASNKSFNRITVDGDTSTNDCCMLAATGKANISIGELDATSRSRFVDSLDTVFVELATQLIKDGEGASKFVTVRVESGKSSNECLRVAYAIAESPLVKTALFAADPNWGRILAVVGRADLDDLELDKVIINIGDVGIVSQGGVDPTYTEEQGQAVMDHDDIVITVALQRGDSVESIWTSDLSHDYVSINADYRS